MDDEQRLEEESRPQRPRVVDKRVSARPPEEAARTTDKPATESPPQPQAAAAPQDQAPSSEGPPGGVWTPAQEEQARRIAEELARTPGPDLIVTFAMNFVEVASVKLEAGDLAGAQLAIDTFEGILNAVGTRLGEAETPMRSVLAQLQMGYAQRATAPPPP